MKSKHVMATFALLLMCGVVVADQFTTGDAAVAIPDNSGGVITACQTITVPGTLTITDTPSVSVDIGHSWIGDLTFELRGPLNTLTVMNRPGRNGTGAGDSSDLQAGTPILFGAMAPSGVTAEAAGTEGSCGGGDFIGGPNCIGDFLPDPDATDTPNAGLGTDFSDFTGSDSVGMWELCVADSAGGDTGTLNSWSLGFNGMPVPVELDTFTVE